MEAINAATLTLYHANQPSRRKEASNLNFTNDRRICVTHDYSDSYTQTNKQTNVNKLIVAE